MVEGEFEFKDKGLVDENGRYVLVRSSFFFVFF